MCVDPLSVSLAYSSAFFVHAHVLWFFPSPQLLVIWLLAGILRRSNASFSLDGAKLSTQETEILQNLLFRKSASKFVD